MALVVTDEQLNASFIVPSVFDPDVPKAVARAVAGAEEEDSTRLPPRAARQKPWTACPGPATLAG